MAVKIIPEWEGLPRKRAAICLTSSLLDFRFSSREKSRRNFFELLVHKQQGHSSGNNIDENLKTLLVIITNIRQQKQNTSRISRRAQWF